MNTLFSGKKRKGVGSSARGYSLSEVLIAASLSSLVLAAVLSSFIFIARSSVGISNYSDMNNESRIGLEIFGRDVRNAEGIETGFSNHSFTLLMPEGADRVSYVYRPNAPGKPLVRREAGEERVVMSGVNELQFNYTNLQGQTNSTMATMEVKQIQLRLTLLRRTISLKNTERVVSARFILRNQEVT